MLLDIEVIDLQLISNRLQDDVLDWRSRRRLAVDRLQMVLGADYDQDLFLCLRLVDWQGSDHLSEVINLLLDYRLRVEIGQACDID